MEKVVWKEGGIAEVNGCTVELTDGYVSIECGGEEVLSCPAGKLEDLKKVIEEILQDERFKWYASVHSH